MGVDVHLARRGGQVICEVGAMPSWEAFDELVRYMKGVHHAEVVECSDGPDARVAKLKIGSTLVQLQHDDMTGNRLVGELDAEATVRAVQKDLAARLRPSGSAGSL